MEIPTGLYIDCGYLLYVANNLHPDFVFTINEYTRFNHHPESLHVIGVKYILKYSNRARTEGL